MNNVYHEIITELIEAQFSYPQWPTDPLHAIGVVAEELGETQKEVLQLCYEPEIASIERLRKEAIQTAAMAIRFLVSIEKYQFKPSENHEQ